jgi:hypothetical protein
MRMHRCDNSERQLRDDDVPVNVTLEKLLRMLLAWVVYTPPFIMRGAASNLEFDTVRVNSELVSNDRGGGGGKAEESRWWRGRRTTSMKERTRARSRISHHECQVTKGRKLHASDLNACMEIGVRIRKNERPRDVRIAFDYSAFRSAVRNCYYQCAQTRFYRRLRHKAKSRRRQRQNMQQRRGSVRITLDCNTSETQRR